MRKKAKNVAKYQQIDRVHSRQMCIYALYALNTLAESLNLLH